MGSNFIFKNGLLEPGVENGSQMENFGFGNLPLSRQSSIYSLTLDEFQTGLGKDFGSMNMDEFLKNVWFAEETQGFGTSPAVAPEGNSGNLASQFSLPRQGSLTLPRMMSLKTVDEVFRDLVKETVVQSGNDSTPFLQRQPTLGEMTLEEFLVRAGVVREDTQSAGMSNNGAFVGNYGNSMVGNTNSQVGSDFGLALGFGRPDRSNGNLQGVVDQSANGTSNLEATRSSQPQPPQQQQQQQQQMSWLSDHYNQSHVVQQPQQQQQLQQQHQLFSKQATIGYATQVQLSTNSKLNGSSMGNGLSLSQVGGAAGNDIQAGRDTLVGIEDSKACIGAISPANNDFARGVVQGGGVTNLNSLGTAKISATTASHAHEIISNGLNKNEGDDSSLSPVPYAFSGGLRGRRGCGAVEKVVERRQRRMIKNRESAARSRARKQAYTMELESEVAKLKEENMKLQKKQEEIMEMQKAQEKEKEKLNHETAPKKKCLRRMQTGPW